MAITEGLKSFVEQVRKSTDNGRIPWEDGADEHEFIASMPGGSLCVRNRWNSEQQSDECALDILNVEGKLADRVSSDTGADYQTLKAIFDSARRQARHADAVMRKMMEGMK
jgi:hypothetical protein